jgi:predicted flap endonuclease-1-like 5' DNA nuclease
MLRRMMRVFTLVLMFALLGVWLYWLRKRGKVTEPVPASQRRTPRIVLKIETTPADESPAQPVADAVEIPEPEKPEPTSPDDLKRIEGIGPKIASLLQDAGITTFAQLAAADVERLREILDAVNLRIANPTTWPEQAALAAAGDLDGLASLQSELKGGRRV